MTRRVAVVEDDELLRRNYAEAFGKQGYEVTTYGSRPAAEAGFSEHLPDLAVIDIGLGAEIDGGFALCQWLRTRSKTLPIIFLSARDNDYDIVSGLRMGADDYVTKDVSLPHLVARIAALFRRVEVMAERVDDPDAQIRHGALSIDSQRLLCQWGTSAVDLTLTEFWMVYALARHPGHVKSRDQLMQQSKIMVDDATITSHIKRIRRKFLTIDPAFNEIESVYGMGYRWNVTPGAS